MKSALVLLALTIPFSASFAKSFPLSGTHSRGAIATKCFKSGGSGYGISKAGGGGYGCFNEAKGTSVHCTPNGKCMGTVPD